MNEKFIARQPIFDDKLKLFAYELLSAPARKTSLSPKKKRPAASS
jgi:c-di-GMP-related signal transduction protein